MSKLNGYEQDIINQKILSVQINLLNRCPSKCKSCRKYTWPDDILPFDDVIKVLKYLKKQGCTSVFFSGGEPLYYPRFSDVIDFCNSIDLPYSLISTFICKDTELLKKIAKTAYRIHVSIDAVDSELYKTIRGVDGFEIAKKSIDTVMAIRDDSQIPIRFSSTIGVYNYDKVFDIYKFAKEHKCIVNFYYIQKWDNLQMDNEMENVFYDKIAEIARDEKKNKTNITNAVDTLMRQYKFDTFEDIKTCYVPRISAIINCDGSIYPCCRLFAEFNPNYNDCLKYSYGNIIGKSESEMRKEFEKRFGTYPNDCYECRECIKCDVRYNNTNKEISQIFDLNFKRKPLFI